MAEFGLTPTGFVPRTTLDIRAQIDGLEQQAFGASFDVSDGSAAGEINGIVAAVAGEVWEVLEQIVASTDRDAAAGVSLDAVGAVTGTLRNAAQRSTVTATITGDPLTVVSTGFTAATASTGAAFATTEDTILNAVAAWVPNHVYATAGDLATNGGKVYVVTTPGTSAASGGPTGTGTAIADGPDTLVWAFVGLGTAAVAAVLTATTTGVVVAAIRDLSVINTPALGVLSVINLVAAVAGETTESDPDYRVRQFEELALGGSNTAAAIAAELRELDGVIAAHVFFNNANTTDDDGVPPHSVEALVEGGDDQEIIDLLGEQVNVGIGTTGNTSGFHTDTEGTTFAVSFTRPTQILVFLRITLTKSAAAYAGDPAVQTTIAAYGDTEQVIGKDLIPSSAGAAALPVRVGGVQVAGVAGVLKIARVDAFTDVIGVPVAWAPTTSYTATPGSRSVVLNDGGRAYICTTSGVSGSTGPTGEGTAITDGGAVWRWLGADIIVSQREIAVLDVSRITVSSSSATP